MLFLRLLPLFITIIFYLFFYRLLNTFFIMPMIVVIIIIIIIIAKTVNLKSRWNDNILYETMKKMNNSAEIVNVRCINGNVVGRGGAVLSWVPGAALQCPRCTCFRQMMKRPTARTRRTKRMAAATAAVTAKRTKSRHSARSSRCGCSSSSTRSASGTAAGHG